MNGVVHTAILGLVGGTKEWTPAHSLRLAMLIGAFIVAVLALGLIIMAVRRRLFAADNEMAGARTLMDDLRAMRKSGEMSEEEYEAARKSLATKMAGKLKAEAAAKPPESYGVKLPRSAMPTPRPPVDRTAPPGYDLTGEPLPPLPSPPVPGDAEGGRSKGREKRGDSGENRGGP